MVLTSKYMILFKEAQSIKIHCELISKNALFIVVNIVFILEYFPKCRYTSIFKLLMNYSIKMA